MFRMERDFKQLYDPGNPDADEKGIVLMPNINPVEEMANLINASRSYEANLAALQTAKQLAMKSMDIGEIMTESSNQRRARDGQARGFIRTLRSPLSTSRQQEQSCVSIRS